MPRTIVFLAADTSPLQPLDLEQELQEIEAKLRSAPHAEAFTLMSHFGTTPDDLQAMLLRERPTVVHVSGHGEEPDAERPGIVLHGKHADDVAVVTGEALEHLAATLLDGIRLVVFNACYSHAQAERVARVVDFVVGIDGAIRDDAARTFAAAFYRGLGFGRDVKTAFDLGVNALMLEGLESEVRLPVLHCRAGVDPRHTTLVLAEPKPADEGWDVYITYAQADRQLAHDLALDLHEREIRVFFDEWEVGLGTAVVRRLEEGIERSKHGVVVVSAASMAQPWVQASYAAMLRGAVEGDKRLIPVIIGDTELPPFLGNYKGVHLRGKTGAEQRASFETIAHALQGRRPGPPVRNGQ